MLHGVSLEFYAQDIDHTRLVLVDYQVLYLLPECHHATTTADVTTEGTTETETAPRGMMTVLRRGETEGVGQEAPGEETGTED